MNERSRTICVKGTGKLSVRPDTIVITMILKTKDMNYDVSMQKASEMLEALQNALKGIGFSEKDLKTTAFDVRCEHESVRDQNNNYKSVFTGYACVHNLKIEFPFDTEKLSKTLSAIASCIADPELNVRFKVGNEEKLKKDLLKSATKDAKAKASVLCSASSVKLGKLLNVQYNWSEPNAYSNTNYAMDGRCLKLAGSANMSVEPENVELSDNVSFIWEIE